jgi:hypothetical protein
MAAHKIAKTACKRVTTHGIFLLALDHVFFRFRKEGMSFCVIFALHELNNISSNSLKKTTAYIPL